jgi:hypothetical protein
MLLSAAIILQLNEQHENDLEDLADVSNGV